ncbi:MAG: alpha/beta hydrolase [Candidatus Altimarinota bacterium]
MKKLLTWLLLFLGVCGASIFALNAFEKTILFQPEKGFDQNLLQTYGLEEIWLSTPENIRLHGVYHEQNPQIIDLFFHGNAGNITNNEPNLRYLREAGVSFFMIDYPGYGLSQGHPSEESFYETAQIAYDYLIKQKNWKPEQIVINGQSLGGAVAVDLASKNPCKSLIIEASFPSTAAVAKHLYPWIPYALITKNKFRSIDKIPQVNCPILILHGDRDDLLPYRFAEELFDAAPEPKHLLTLPDLGHNDVLEYGKQGDYVEKINRFITTGEIQ